MAPATVATVQKAKLKKFRRASVGRVAANAPERAIPAGDMKGKKTNMVAANTTAKTKISESSVAFLTILRFSSMMWPPFGWKSRAILHHRLYFRLLDGCRWES